MTIPNVKPLYNRYPVCASLTKSRANAALYPLGNIRMGRVDRYLFSFLPQ